MIEIYYSFDLLQFFFLVQKLFKKLLTLQHHICEEHTNFR